ncbi:MAG: hypothetical protein JRH20_06740 [Deltaproteobacteria bacterium]|nr:hypothetical protein [Deltaproteobacteria bacterium]
MLRWLIIGGVIVALGTSCTRLVTQSNTQAPDTQAPDTQAPDTQARDGTPDRVSDMPRDSTGDSTDSTDSTGDQVAEGLSDQSSRDHATRTLSLTTAWAKSAGDGSSDWVNAVAIDDAGNITVVGQYVTSISFGGSLLRSVDYNDGFVARFDASGTHLWSHSIGGTSNDEGTAIVDTGTAIVLGAYCGGSCKVANQMLPSSGSAVVVARFDPDGTLVWAKRAGGSGRSSPRSIVFDGKAITLVGRFADTIDFGNNPLTKTAGGGDDAFIAQLDAAGQHVWSKRFGAEGLDLAEGISSDGQGGFVVGGSFEHSIDLGGGSLVSRGSSDVVIARLDGAGRHVWSSAYGSTGFDETAGIAVDSAGTIYLTGSFQHTISLGGTLLTNAGGADVFLASYDRQGQHQWSKSFGGTTDDRVKAISSSADGVITIAGNTGDDIDLGAGLLSIAQGMFIGRYSFDGSHRWSRGYQGRLDAKGIAENASHRIVIGGEISESADFGTGLLMSRGMQDALIVVLSP